MKTWLRVAAALVVIPLLGVGIGSAQDDKCFEKGGFWDPEQERCVVKSGIEIDIKYPLEIVTYPFVEQTVDEFLFSTRSRYVSDFVEYGMAAWSPGPGDCTLITKSSSILQMCSV
jgi:hypothetical protein